MQGTVWYGQHTGLSSGASFIHLWQYVGRAANVDVRIGTASVLHATITSRLHDDHRATTTRRVERFPLTVLHQHFYAHNTINCNYGIYNAPLTIRPMMNYYKVNPLTPTVAIWVTSIKHAVPDRVKQSFVIFDIRALWRSALTVEVPGCQKLQMTA